MQNPQNLSADLCYGCFDAPQAPLCSKCGYQEHKQRSPLFLPHGTQLNHHYIIGRGLGNPGGFGIVYLVRDRNLRKQVAILLPT